MPGLWLLRAMAGAIGNVTAVMAFTALPMAEAFSLIFLLPIFVTILSVVFLREHVGWRRWSAVIVGFLGVLVVLRPGFRHLGTGHVAAIICGITGALSIIALRMAGATEKRITLYGAGVIGPMIAGFIMMLPHFRLAGRAPVVPRAGVRTAGGGGSGPADARHAERAGQPRGTDRSTARCCGPSCSATCCSTITWTGRCWSAS